MTKDATLIGNRQYPKRLALWKKLLILKMFYIYEPKKLALTKTTKAPNHIITKTEVIIVFDYDSVL